MNITDYVNSLTALVPWVGVGRQQPENDSKSIINEIDAAKAADPEFTPDSSVTKWAVPLIELLNGNVYSEAKNFRFTVLDYGLPTETVLPRDRIENPLPDMFAAVTYLNTGIASGWWIRFEEEQESEGGDKRQDLGFFTFKAWVPVDGQPDQIVEKRFMMTYDDQGNATHKEIV